MTQEEYLIISDPEICGGKPVARGTRVPVEYILELWDAGYSVKQVHEEYPTVPEPLVEAIVHQLRDNKLLKIVH